MGKLSDLGYHASQTLKWLGRRRVRRTVSGQPTQVVFCMVDHYEPGTGHVDVATEKARVDALLSRYPVLAGRHRDGDGRMPRRTWFFPPHYHRHGTLARLVSLCDDGFGEIELHLHHGKYVPDTAENLRATILRCVEEYSRYGIFGEVDGQKRYGFIHGDSALNNSRGGKYCGVNNETEILLGTGCYADFTHPSGPQTGPTLTNEIFYDEGRRDISKSHDNGMLCRAGARGKGLLIVQGPSHPARVPGTLGSIRIVGDHIPDRIPTTASRVKMWIDTGVAVTGQDDIIFIKVSTHGAPHECDALGGETEIILRELETRYNDGERYRLHYVTAREMYNVIRAIEDGRYRDGDVLGVVDYHVKAPRYDTSWREDAASPLLQELIFRTYRG